MKTFLGVALTALVLLAPALSEAQTRTQPQSAVTAATTSAPSYNRQHPYAVFDYQDGVHLMPISPVSRSAAVVAAPRDSTLGLVDATGNGP
jgi:hypothetical protein